ncbi:MAG: hypothetical protein ACREGI_01180 [Candidatus Levyibacteriota bacterium]
MPQKKSMSVQDWMSMMENWFMKLPSLPKNAKDAIVSITPWIALVFGVLGVLGGLAGLGVLTAFSPFVMVNGGWGGAAGSIIAAVISLVASVLLLMGFPGTKKRQMKGWKMLFYSQVASVVASVVSFSVAGVLVNLIGFYLLFQIKSYYK